MSFGYGVSDLITTSTLAWRIYRTCKDSSDDFRAISSEVASLHIVLKEIEETLSDQSLTSGQETQLSVLTDGCSAVLDDLDKLLKKYHGLGTQSQRTWDRMKWGLEDIQAIRERLISSVTLLNAFNTTFINSSQARVEEKLNQLVTELRAGKRGSTITTRTINSLSTEDKEVWRQLRKELEDIGISAGVLKQHQQFIVTWFGKAVRTGAFEGVIDTGEAISLAEPGKGDEEQHPLPDPVLERVFDARVTCRSRSDKCTKASITQQDHQTLDLSTNRQPRIRMQCNPRLLHMRNLLFPVTHDDFFDAVQEGNLEKVKELLIDTGLNVNCRKEKKMTALHLAVYKGQSDIAELLLEKGANIEAKDCWGSTALFWAGNEGHLGLIEVLLDKGANIEAKNRDGSTVLDSASSNGHSDAVTLLLTKGATLRSKNKNGWTALHQAAYKGHANVIELLLSKGVVIEAGNKDGFTALSIAAFQGHSNALEMLLKKGADINAKCWNGATSLHQASHEGHIRAVELLLTSKEVDINAETIKGRTALSFAVLKNHPGVVVLLIQKGAYLDGQGAEEEATPLHKAVKAGHLPLIKLLLDEGALVSPKSTHYAASRGKIEIVKLLLDRM